ncbi:EAL domain-containing protein [Halorhodospira sp. 9622]|uniref:EAL domain-containing protein n=1 Tax=Halorhodospira sp. 9622 TaxID=2899136 RepID=UPI001EE7C861|nr:EAL domain-containing protein [Halorhodospira sp. 9622]MCG5538617.1 EAL domain-containing protein [Halorhodospira sp. 9622]
MTEQLEQFVRRHAQKQRLSLTELAQRAGMSRQSLYGLWQSDRHPNLSKMIELAEALRVHPLRLIEHYLAATVPPRTVHNGLLDVNCGDDRTRLLEALLNDADEAIIGFNHHRQIVVYNSMAEVLLRTPAHKVRRATIDSILPTEAAERLLERAHETYNGRQNANGQVRSPLYFQVRCGDDGVRCTLSARVTELRFEEGPITLLWVNTADANASASDTPPTPHGPYGERTLSREPQTGLPAADQVDELLRRGAVFANWLETHMALVILDFEALRRAAGTLGPDVCKQLLRAAADALQGSLRRTDRIALADDHALAIILPGLTEQSDAREMVDRLRHSINQSPEANQFHVDMTPRAGVALFPDDAQSPDVLRHLSWAALEAAGREGEMTRLVDRPLVNGVSEQVALLRDLQTALHNRELELRYEPIHELNGGRCVALEALVCWTHPEQGFIDTPSLLNTAGQAGLLGELEAWTVDQVFRDLQTLAGGRTHWPRVAINVTAEGILHDALDPDRLRRGLNSIKAPRGTLELEVAERELSATDTALTRRMSDLRSHGIHMAIDHFGHGHAPLFEMPELPADRLKVPCPALGTRGTADQVGLTSIVARLAVQSRLMLSATGVDSQQAVTQLHNLGFDEAQGPYFSTPMPAGDLPAYLSVAALNNN